MFIKKKTKIAVLLALIILLGMRLCMMYSLRVSHMLDEAYSYGFANNPGEPWFIHEGITEDGIKELVHYGKWYSGSEFVDFLVVNEGEQFDFVSVIQNKLEDTSPSNFEIILHFVCSFFPGKFSWDYAFAVNLIFYIGTLILLYHIVCLIFEKDKYSHIYAYLCMIFFSFTICGTGAFTFLRMYGILSFYALLDLFLIMKISTCKGKKIFIYGIALCLSSFFGFFTHFNFLIYAFGLTLFSCISLMLGRKFKEMLVGGLSQLLSVVLFFIIYPFPFGRADTWMADENADSFSYFTRLGFSNMHMFGESIGFYIPFSVASIIQAIGRIVLVLIIVLLMFFLFRKENWFISAKERMFGGLRVFGGKLKNIVKESCPILPVIFLTAVFYMLVVNAIAPIMTTKGYVTRYFFIGMHLVIISFISLLIIVFKNLVNKKIISVPAILIICVVLLYNQNVNYGNPFILNIPFDDDEVMRDFTDGKDVMIFSSDVRDLYSLIVPLRDVNSFYFSLANDEGVRTAELPQGDFYVMADKDSFPDEQVNGSGLGGYNPVGGVGGSIYDYISDRLIPDGSREIVFVRDYNSYAGEYGVYLVKQAP